MEYGWPSQPQGDAGVPLLPKPAADGPVSVAELQHPLRGKARALILKAESDLQARKIQKCFDDLDKAVKIPSAVPYAHSVRGAAFLLGGRVSEALAELQEAVAVLRLSGNYSNLAYAHLLNGETGRAEKELHRALELNTSAPQSRFLMGLVLLDSRPRNEEACDNLEEAGSLTPIVHVALAICYERGGRGNAADRQIREYLGPSRESRFDTWKQWVVSTAAEKNPSTAFGLPPQSQSSN